MISKPPLSVSVVQDVFAGIVCCIMGELLIICFLTAVRYTLQQISTPDMSVI